MELLKFSVRRIQNRIMSYYAVAIGRQVGIYNNWSKCEEQIKGFKGAKYKKFPTRIAAAEFIKNNCTGKTHSITPPVKANDYWPESDGDTFNEHGLTEKELLSALEDVEKQEQSSTSLKRKNIAKSDARKRIKQESMVLQPVGSKKIGKYEFEVDSEDYVIVYTDGSCFNNGQKNACAGYGVYFGDNHPLNVSSPVTGRVTNNVGEIQASIYAVRTALSLGITKLCISTDSQFLIKSVTLWIEGWKSKGWRLRNGDPVKNVDEFKELDGLLSGKNIDIKWNYVAAHIGIKGNEMADRLAREGSETYKRLHLNL